MNDAQYTIERPARAVLIVRMKSKQFRGRPLPDAAFTFRVGDPQYDVWEARYWEQQQRRADAQAPTTIR